MKLIIETHTYAPELNKILLVKGGVIKAPNVTTIRDARKLFYPIQSFKYCKIRVFHPLIGEKFYNGRISSYNQVKRVMSELKEKHNLKGTTFNVKTTLIG